MVPLRVVRLKALATAVNFVLSERFASAVQTRLIADVTRSTFTESFRFLETSVAKHTDSTSA